jgi:hypothetical protein
MLISVAGPCSAASSEDRQRQMDALNDAAAALLKKGHIAVVGVGAAMPVVERASLNDPQEVLLAICLAIVDRCDALLVLGDAPIANRERERMRERGLPVFRAVDEIPNEPDEVESL